MKLSVDNYERYEGELVAIVRSVDPAALIKFCARWERPSPDRAEVAEVTLHKMRAVMTAFTVVERAESRAWLTARGYGWAGKGDLHDDAARP